MDLPGARILVTGGAGLIGSTTVDLLLREHAPSQVLEWAVNALAKAGTLSIVGVYPTSATRFPIGKAMNKNLTLNMGNCNHRKYIPELLSMIQTGAVRPSRILTNSVPLDRAIEAYRSFDRREPGWTKVELQVAA